MRADPSRRALLAAAAAVPLAAAGCRGVGALAPPPRPAPDVAVLKAAIAGERQLIARYLDVAAGQHAAGLADVLDPLLAEHRQHLAQLRGRLIVPRGAASASSPAHPPAPSATASPASPAAALAALRRAEQQASAALLTGLSTVPPSLAQLLASISASEATHSAILRTAGGSR
ncbi:MAG TPA: hypothetical protein VH637_14180 [Streptosporangiaceae bacterium]